jgi:hypothetical protein
MDSVCRAEPIGRTERRCQLGRGFVHRAEGESTEERAELEASVTQPAEQAVQRRLVDGSETSGGSFAEFGHVVGSTESDRASPR